MSGWYLWLSIAVTAAVTYALRFTMLPLARHYSLPDWLLRALRFVPAAVLSALLMPRLFFREEGFSLGIDNLRLYAAIIAAFVAWRSKNIAATLLTGMAALWLLTWLLG